MSKRFLSAYNSYGRRDNKYKARIKIMVQELGVEEVRARVDRRFFSALRAEWQGGRSRDIARIAGRIRAARLSHRADRYLCPSAQMPTRCSARGPDTNLHPHRAPGYAIVTISLKAHGATPGDATSAQMRALADLAETYGHGELRISHEQNVILPHVHESDLPALHQRLRTEGLATANIGLISDIIACPGMDYCALATARSIPVAQDIAQHFAARELDIGAMKIKISGCINACGHHHLGHIGILGLDRAGVENYQITLGGDATETAALGQRTGPGFAHDQVIPALDRLVNTYLALRSGPSESFIDTLRRLGHDPFKAALYERDADVRAA